MIAPKMDNKRIYFFIEFVGNASNDTINGARLMYVVCHEHHCFLLAQILIRIDPTQKCIISIVN